MTHIWLKFGKKWPTYEDRISLQRREAKVLRLATWKSYSACLVRDFDSINETDTSWQHIETLLALVLVSNHRDVLFRKNLLFCLTPPVLVPRCP